MTEKTRIVEALGERALLLPVLVNQALAANDRAKYVFTLLQSARSRADHPDADAPMLQAEREAAGIADATLDGVVAAARKLNGSVYCIPHAGELCRRLLEEVQTMVAPLRAHGDAAAAEHEGRLEALAGDLRSVHDDGVTGTLIDAMTSANRKGPDSLHLLVMDLHKALNKLQAGIAEASIDGAKAYGLMASDRGLVRAFMKGVNRTAPLKFDHPGLATTATRHADALVLQNDIGSTDAHVLVVHVTADAVRVTCTDVHLARLLFFHSLFEGFPLEWQDTLSRSDKAMESGVYHLSVGTFRAADRAEQERFLVHLGSRLVFLIDWNRARKRLRPFVGKTAAVECLKWAADNDLGHMAFLKAGGERLIYDALEFALKGPFRLGETLGEMLGDKAAVKYVKFVLRASAEGLLQGRHESLIQDEVRAELFNYIRSARHGLLDIAAEHAALTLEIAAGLRDALIAGPAEPAALERNALRAKEWEGRADELVNRARSASREADVGAFYRGLLESADDISDELEEAAFHITLVPAAQAPSVREPLGALAALVASGVQEYVKVLETARFVRRGVAREDMHDFLQAVHRILDLEHESDATQRRVKAALVGAAPDFRQLYVLSEAAANLEHAADGLMHVALKLREHCLGQVMSA